MGQYLFWQKYLKGNFEIQIVRFLLAAISLKVNDHIQVYHVVVNLRYYFVLTILYLGKACVKHFRFKFYISVVHFLNLNLYAC